MTCNFWVKFLKKMAELRPFWLCQFGKSLSTWYLVNRMIYDSDSWHTVQDQFVDDLINFLLNSHYENKPIQIYWKFFHQKKKKKKKKNENFLIKILIFFLFLLKT